MVKYKTDEKGKWELHSQNSGAVVELLVEPSQAWLAEKAARPKPPTKEEREQQRLDKLKADLKKIGVIV